MVSKIHEAIRSLHGIMVGLTQELVELFHDTGNFFVHDDEGEETNMNNVKSTDEVLGNIIPYVPVS